VKVLHVTPSFYPAVVYGGPTQSTYRLCRALARAGCATRVLTTNANGLDAVLDVTTGRAIDLEPNLSVRYCRRLALHSVSPELLARLRRALDWADVVNLMSVYSFPTIPTLALSRAMDKPVVWSLRGMLQRFEGTRRVRTKAAWERVCRAVAPERLLLHATSAEEAAASETRWPGARIAVVPNGVDVPDDVARDDGGGVFRVAFLGRIDPIKGLENLIDAFAIASPRLGSSRLTIAGNGETEYVASLAALAAKRGIADRVELIGPVRDDAKGAFFAGADVAVLPSHSESFGIVVAEALAHAVPVIASTGTPWRRVESESCGAWTKNDAASLAEGLVAARRWPLREMGERGRAWMRREFGWGEVARSMMSAYERAATSR
jgi:glycosyltransferase involved in cell wall biosynthesis